MDPIVVPIVGAGVACGIIGGGQAIEGLDYFDHGRYQYGTKYNARGRRRYQLDLSGRKYEEGEVVAQGELEREIGAGTPRNGRGHYEFNDQGQRRTEAEQEQFRLEMLENEGFRRARPGMERLRKFPARLGLKISASSPYFVENIYTLMDPHGWKQWERRYTNPEMHAGDRLLAVDGADVQQVDLTQLNARLGDKPYSVRTLTLHSNRRNERYQVTLVRHVAGKRPPWTRPNDSVRVPDRHEEKPYREVHSVQPNVYGGQGENHRPVVTYRQPTSPSANVVYRERVVYGAEKGSSVGVGYYSPGTVAPSGVTYYDPAKLP
eukprot:Tamp_23675.p1 GENE.Tamp_23675~~Tamp_23675.p1  ORF type:complete len:333 (+),score=30.00 Tamp_23675:40-999(+)